MVERNTGMPVDRRIEFRIGVHLGDERSGFVVVKRLPIGGAAALGRGHGGR